MKLKFDIINKNIETYHKAYNIFTQIQDYQNNLIEWSDIVDLELNDLCSFNSSFHKILNNSEKYKILSGKETIDFKTLKTKMIKALNRLNAKASKIVKENSLICDEFEEKTEYKTLSETKILFKEMDEDKFKEYFKCDSNFIKLFPSLYRLEMSVYDELYIYINNYLITNKVEIGSDVFNDWMFYKSEDYNALLKIPTSELVEEKLYEISNSDKILEDFFNSIENSGSVNWKYLERKLKNEFKNIDRDGISKLQKINDRNIKIDKIVD